VSDAVLFGEASDARRVEPGAAAALAVGVVTGSSNTARDAPITAVDATVATERRLRAADLGTTRPPGVVHRGKHYED
jgi:hypothetical protein